MATIHSINLIASDPDVRGGRPCIAGTGVRVSDVVMVMLFHTDSPGEIAAWFGLPLAQIHAALAYYYEHKAEIDADIREQIARAEEFKEKRVGSRGAAPAPHAL
ncbi:MAG: DUF433 domain-containing protein [Anaerolineae bacterium]|nr:DUF433 domain-containing protein [Anaerolineae bacterium]